MYEENNPYSQYDANGQTPQELLARLLTLQNRIASTVTSVGEAQSSIEQNAEQILLRVEKNGVISAINQSPEEISILASRINLVGAVTVLSDITGDLGTITAGTINGVTLNGITINGGNINVANDVYVGSNLYVGNLSGGTAWYEESKIRFANGYASSYAEIQGSTVGSLDLVTKGNVMGYDGAIGLQADAVTFVTNTPGAYVEVLGRLDFSGATVIGLDTTARFG